jgi:hypothetical protein
MRKKGQLMRDSLKARMAAILAASGLLVAAPVVLVQGASAQVANNCASTVLTGGIGNGTGNGSEADSDNSCEAEGTSISQSGDNTNFGAQVGNVGVALCFAGATGSNVCPVVNGDVEQEQEQNAGHQAEAYTGGSKKAKAKKSKKKNKKH